ncbi:MAG: SDR family NAD(P)-dependent oxidoreductase [Alphaproteobacteria bacterium]|nr:SDR family NAD(P)-dependent oxidoreductase [Alphaproteobacteria bacterium]
MDGSANFSLDAIRPARETPRTSLAPHSFLFLQGPISTFFDRLGRALIESGHRVQRINLHGGDRLFWHLPAINYRGDFAEWREFVAGVLEREQVTHLLLHGDRRPYHLVAAEEARARGIAVIATDLGYLRPDWLTLEYDGMTSYSRFPRDPDAVRRLAREFDKPDLQQRFSTPFRVIASLDVAYNLGLVFGKPLYPHYRYHSICHPFTEYAGWLWSRGKGRLNARAMAGAKERLKEKPGTYFLVPLQLATDYQIRAHSPYDDIRTAVRTIVRSFAASRSERDLVFSAHPLDNGLIDWPSFLAEIAQEAGIAGRVSVLAGGTPNEILFNAAGVVTINSTIGITALHNGVPVKVLGNAVFDIAGLTCQQPLDQFWHHPEPPDPTLMTAFVTALAGTTQVKGGYYFGESQKRAVIGFVERLEQGLYPLSPAATGEWLPPRDATRGIVVTGAESGVGQALARGYAAPGVRLCLVAADTARLHEVAADCRQRGALVELVTYDSVDDSIAAIDQLTAIEKLVLCADIPLDPTLEQLTDRDLLRSARVIRSVAAAMRSRAAGQIILVSSLSGRAGPSDTVAACRAHRAWAVFARDLRRQLARDGISLTTSSPGRIALDCAAWFGHPKMITVSPERAAAAVMRGATRDARTIRTLGHGRLTLRALRLLPRRLAEIARDTLLYGEDGFIETPADRTLASKTGSAD